ncbi:MAG: hypothetical protein AAGE52_24075 [Myxococcota bacterium]
MRFVLLLGLVLGCPRGEGTTAVRVEYPAPVPAERTVRQDAMRELGSRLYRALKNGRSHRLLLDDAELGRVLDEDAATRARALRPGARLRVQSERYEAFERARFSGVCLQGARQEAPGGPLGLRQEGWVFERVLVVGTQPGGRRLASWVEGSFVFTNAGFGAIALTRVEAPRWEHSDLELATCDMEVGVTDPQDIVVATD